MPAGAQRSDEPASKSGAFESRASRGRQVMLIEDDDDIRDALSGLLLRAGYHVREYARAADALGAMESGYLPDVILLDLMMPGMNGWQFRAEQRARPSLAQVPVIVLSADSSPYAAAIDAQARLLKPIDFGRLTSTIDSVLTEARRRQLAQKAIQVERMNSLGMLVASVAHEINNPLTYVLGNLDLAHRNTEKLAAVEGDEHAARLQKLDDNLAAVRDGTERVAFIVRLLSTFVSADRDSARPVDPLHAIDAAVRLAILHIRDRAQLVCDVKQTPKIRINEARLAQVFLNLLLNAAQAIPKGGRDRHEVRIRALQVGTSVVLEVQDTGVGIPRELRDRIFEPFFTTKPPGMATGVGLSIARETVIAAGGSISVQSEPGKGATFRLSFPAVESDGTDDEANEPKPVRSERQRVLVVDDEPMIGRLVEAALDGHLVETTVEPTIALGRIADGSYDLVLCDLKMPHMSGIEFYAELIKRRPDLSHSFVLMTGAASDAELDEFIVSNAVSVLRKPFMMKDLRERVAEHARNKALRR